MLWFVLFSLWVWVLECLGVRVVLGLLMGLLMCWLFAVDISLFSLLLLGIALCGWVRGLFGLVGFGCWGVCYLVELVLVG